MSDTFEFNGTKYSSNPDIKTLLKEAGLNKRLVSKYRKKLKKNGINETTQLLSRTIAELEELGFTETSAPTIFQHIQRVKRLGGMMQDYDKIKKFESEFSYISTGSTMLDEMMTYSDGQMGLRSKTMIELYGEASTGKSQICMTAAAMCLRPVDNGGFGRAVAYIDSEGAFEGRRFDYLCRYWGVEQEFLEENLFYSRVTTFDEVEMALEELDETTATKDFGLIIIDSIIDPLKSQYIVGGKNLTNLQPRQQHLQRVLSSLKNLAVNNNAVALYTNHIMNNIQPGFVKGPATSPAGGHVIAHASDIRIELSRPAKKEYEKWYEYKDHNEIGIKPGRAKITDCGFLPEGKGFYLVGPFGIGDPRHINELAKVAEKSHEKGYLAIDARGDDIEHLDPDQMSREDRVEQIMAQLYGTKDE